MPIELSALPRVSIYLEHGDSTAKWCQHQVLEEFEQLTVPSQTWPDHGEAEVNASLLVIPDDIERDWWALPSSKWMRYKVRQARKIGYTFSNFEFNDRLDDIYAINTSMLERQGREMSAWYQRRPRPQTPEEVSCRRHRFDWLGVFQEGTLYAYALAIQMGEMMTFSTILGHGDRLDDGIMNLLVYETVKRNQEVSGSTYARYHLQHRGSEGLQFFKRKMGFAGHLVRFDLRSPSRADPALGV